MPHPEYDPDLDERRRRRRRTALITFACLFPFLFIGAYALLLIISQPPKIQPEAWVDGAELQSVRWEPAPARTLDVDIRLFRKDGRKPVLPQRIRLMQTTGLRYQLDGETSWTYAWSGAALDAHIVHKMNPVTEPMDGHEIRVLTSNRTAMPVDPFAWLRWLPGMTLPPIPGGWDYEAGRVRLPPEPRAAGKPVSASD